MVFVTGAAPQERVRARVISRKSRFLEAELIEVLDPSPFRRSPRCPVADSCGGCTWQHVSYSEQVRQKEGILAGSLRGLAKKSAFETLSFLQAESEFEYRNRIQIQIQGEKIGFFAKGSHRLVEVRHCDVSEPSINACLQNFDPLKVRGASRVELAVDEITNEVVVRDRREAHTALFGQINRRQNEVLKRTVVSLIEDRLDWAMDLYAGAGNLSFPLAEHVAPAPVLAVELSQSSVARGRERGMAQIEWRAGDVARVLRETPVRSGQGCIVLDPPRMGCESEVLEQVVRHRPKQIVYVSCSPATFARDAERLVATGKYRLESVQGLDMFPQTEHVELIAHLRVAAL